VAKVAWLDCVNPHSSRVFSSGVALVDYVDGLGAAQESKSKSTRTTHSSELPWRLSSTALFSKSCSTKVHVSALRGSSLKPQAKSLSYRGSGVALLTAQSVEACSPGPWVFVLLHSFWYCSCQAASPSHTRLCRISQVRIASLLKL
jgi:hypothetical protein